jgi:F0F1-type ATP synthase delta subunit
MKISSRKLALTLVEYCEGKSDEEMKGVVKDFITFLAGHNLLTQWREIEQNIHIAWKEVYGVSNVTILSAHELTDSARKALQESVKGAEVKELVNEKLIGGSVLRIDDTRIDGTVAGTLQRLKMELSR